ncbi:SIR2 family protein [Fluviibacterium sp. S390]|uniref:SIR2 family NAD-dependent protein deacylase n=1 Tax=Fluviibacterium sp. S390 TaxID=3415139 RepID=UPI003C7E831B
MTISISSLVSEITPSGTVLLFGAGASLPSGAPSVGQLCEHLAPLINEQPNTYNFADLCALFEFKKSRKELVSKVRERFKGLRPAGGIQNVAEYDWVSIFTTNYDDLVERSFSRKNKEIRVFSSNFDFGESTPPNSTPIFKIHGTIGLDVSDGHRSKLILTDEDNESVEDYREAIYDRMKNDMNSHDVVIIGQSLSDPDLDKIVKRAIKLRQNSASSRKIFLLLYTEDNNRAMLLERKGIRVAFGGIDEFFFELAKQSEEVVPVYQTDDDPVSQSPTLSSITVDVEHQASQISPDFGKMFAGGSPSYSDIKTGYTFPRTIKNKILENLQGDLQYAVVLGASGVGKTTLARQVAYDLLGKGYLAWEHNPDREFLASEWRAVAQKLQSSEKNGVLVLDDAHLYLQEVNNLVNFITDDCSSRLHLILASARNHWKPRVKSPNLFRYGEVFELSILDAHEIGSLLSLVERVPEISKLVDRSFRGFTLQERRRRLVERCNKDFFVCMKNIFANDSFDTIILREFSGINPDYQSVYKFVCALESFGVRVHRQLIVRLLQITAQDIGMVLGNLEGLVDEYPINQRESIFGWGGRHPVISEIVSTHKFNGQEEIFGLLKQVISSISPTYDIEIRTLRQLCSFDGGLSRISDVTQQNELLRMMISVAPRERVPRHRLITNLIRNGHFSDAETEIRIFENDLKADGPVRRHKVRLLTERAVGTVGLMLEDKAAMLNEAFAASTKILNGDQFNRQNLQLHADVCLELYKVSGDYSFIDDVLEAMKYAEKEVGDPDITRAIHRFERRISPINNPDIEMEVIDETE